MRKQINLGGDFGKMKKIFLNLKDNFILWFFFGICYILTGIYLYSEESFKNLSNFEWFAYFIIYGAIFSVITGGLLFGIIRPMQVLIENFKEKQYAECISPILFIVFMLFIVLSWFGGIAYFL